MIKKPLVFVFYFIVSASATFSQLAKIDHDTQLKKISFGNEKIQLVLDYNRMARISLLVVNGQTVISGDSGMYTAFKINGAVFSTLHLSKDPEIKIADSTIRINRIGYGNKQLTIKEDWKFIITSTNILFSIERKLSKKVMVEDMALPVFTFNNMATWEGAYQDYGGLAWFYLFNKKLDTYGVHSHSSKFWNSKTGNGLMVDVVAPGQQVAMEYRRTPTDQLAFSITTASQDMIPRFDPGTNRRRYTRDTTVHIWAPYKTSKQKVTQTISLSYFNFNEQFGRGKFVGINGDEVTAVLNTIARIGVIDKQHFGGNSWHTPYGPVCLHEQYIAQIGLAINDDDYLRGYKDCLDFYRDNAIKPSGRVWPRWAYSNEDMMPGEVTDKGFYEAQWGYLMDSNPDFVTNVAELFDQTGDLAWVGTHKSSCEKVLDWILGRDQNNKGLVEMITDSTSQHKGSDWIDIIWASYENAFVNANLYHALVLWAAIEKQLGDTTKQSFYNGFALKLKASFNRPTSEGGFWDEAKQCYVHWRDRDGSIHGTNMVTPVNFMAIAYGICEDARAKIILDDIENQMQQEKLFFWPLCMRSYAAGEGKEWQFPFPEYENGDLFLSWGSVAVKAYAWYKPEIALKYVKNVLNQYAKDGLAFQRYGRLKQDGRGDDILSGNCLSVVGLYQSVYGINPLFNRFFLDPHITPALAGTELNYRYRGQTLTIGLGMNRYSVSNDRFSVTDHKGFGFFSIDTSLSYFNGNCENASLQLKTASDTKWQLEIKEWQPAHFSWAISNKSTSSGQLSFQLDDLEANMNYMIRVDKQSLGQQKSDAKGVLVFVQQMDGGTHEVSVTKE